MAHNTWNVDSVWRSGLLSNKVVLCTGGSGDICSSQVRALVQLGANACIIGRSQEKADRVAQWIASARAGSQVLALGNVDVRKFSDMETCASKCAEKLGSIDFVIAGAAGNFLAPFTQLSNNAFKSVIDIDLMGSWNIAKATTPYLIKAASKDKSTGRIIFVGSTGQYTGRALNTHASVAKAGVDALSAQLAIELGPRGVTSNVIAPGPIADTEGVKRLIESSVTANKLKEIPLGTLGGVEDIANATVFLFSGAGKYVNGHVLVVDGGAWRTGGGQIGTGYPYPDFLLSDKPVGLNRFKGQGKL